MNKRLPWRFASWKRFSLQARTFLPSARSSAPSPQWMITCKLTNSVPAMVVLGVEWLSLLLYQLLHPEEAVVLEAGGVLSQRRLFDCWLRETLLESREQCLAFLLCLSELHVWREEHCEQFPGEEEGVILVPHAMRVLVPPCMAEAVRECISHPHGGWRAKPLEGEESGEMSFSSSFLRLFSMTLKEDGVCRRRVVDPVVFSQLLLYLKSSCGKPVLIPCRRVGLVQVDPEQARWFLVCWTLSSITLSAVDCMVFFLCLWLVSFFLLSKSAPFVAVCFRARHSGGPRSAVPRNLALAWSTAWFSGDLPPRPTSSAVEPAGALAAAYEACRLAFPCLLAFCLACLCCLLVCCALLFLVVCV